MSTSSQNLIHFAIRYHRENIRVLQSNVTDSEKNVIVYYALWGRNWTFHVKCDVDSMNQRKVPYHTRLKSNFDRSLYIIFFITQIHRVRFVCVKGEASRVSAQKKIFGKNILKRLEKNCWKKKFEKKILKKMLEIFFLKWCKKVLAKNFWKNKLQNTNIHNQNL